MRASPSLRTRSSPGSASVWRPIVTTTHQRGLFSRQLAVGGKEITMTTRADDELEIMRLLARLAQAVDDRDADAYRDCLADEVVCLVSDTSPNDGWRAMPGEAYARWAVESVS